MSSLKDSRINNLYSHISFLEEKYPNNLAIIDHDDSGNVKEEISYSLLKKKIEDFAGFLLHNNLSPGDSCAVALRNSSELLLLSWAAWSIGIITVPLDMKRDTIKEHIYKIKLSKAKIVFTKKDQFKGTELKQIEDIIKVLDIGDIKENLNVNNKYWKKDLSYQALILFTSGTTAYPKGVQLSLENLIVNAEGVKDWFSIQNTDRFMVNLPLHHINSTTFCLGTLLAGASIAIFPNYSNSKFWQRVALSSSTFTSVVPSICFDQLAREREFNMVKDKIKLNRIQIGSAPVLVSDVKEFMAKYKISLYQGYGQTETALRVTGVPIDLGSSLYEKLINENSVGKPMKWADVEILDDIGNILGEGEEGEIAVKGRAVTKGYIKESEGFKNGYFMTGDIGYFKIINSQRYFFLKGRKKEIIIKGGINISPVSVENKLKLISNDIDQVYVIGVSDKRYGEEVAAVICWKKNIDVEKARMRLSLKLIFGSEHISSYETPQYLISFEASNLPMTSTGKVQRSLLENKVDNNVLESVYTIHKSSDYTFLYLSLSSSYFIQAFNLYNYCWDPLIISIDQFRKQARDNFTIIAIDKNNKVEGLIVLQITNLSEKELSSISYNDLMYNGIKIVDGGKNIVCVAICSSNYKKQEIPQVNIRPTLKEVQNYLFSGKDGIYNFHTKAKGGFKQGAKLIAILSNSRPEDKSSLGFNMLMKYPDINKNITIEDKASVSAQLIEVVMFLAEKVGIKSIYAFSRPANLANYLKNRD